MRITRRMMEMMMQMRLMCMCMVISVLSAAVLIF